mmetsp:Transcript_4813/g.7636  ORF Transcript_4813/g.7636 Transcript_4813/m.7636 type:complete len:633 (-) Transcript_4813:244-2142(-)
MMTNMVITRVTLLSAIVGVLSSVSSIKTQQQKTALLAGCDIFHENQCQGDTIVTNASFENHRWFTPPQGSAGYLPSFQDYSELVAYAHVQYADQTRDQATVEVRAIQKDPSLKLKYYFDGVAQESPNKTFSSQTYPNKTLLVSISDESGSKIVLEPVDFLWNNPNIASRHGDYRNGQKGAIVEMFGWPDSDVEQECEFLSKAGYLGAKLFPHQEQLMSYEPFNNVLNPWYFMYQPVSYRLEGRMGSRRQLRALIDTCRSKGVRMYADAVINHMTGGGNDMGNHRNPQQQCVTWGNKSSSLIGEGGPSPFYTQDFIFEVNKATKQPASQEFPAAAYGPTDFHCERALNSWTDPLDLNAGWLTGLTDLNTEKEHVQERIAAYLTDLISVGFSGFRIDAAKHIKPDDLVQIFSKLRRNLGGSLPDDFITWWEVLLGGEGDLLMCNGDSGYNYGSYIEDAFKSAGFSADDINKIKIWNSGYPKETEKGLINCDQNSAKIRSVIQNDDADQQNPGSSSRDMGDDGCVLIKGCDVSEHRNFEVKLFENPNGAQDNDNDFPIRVVLSSFFWYNNGVQGIPDGKSDCSLCKVNCDSCEGVPYIAAYDPTSKGYDSGNGTYTRVHRDAEIIEAMQKWMKIM